MANSSDWLGALGAEGAPAALQPGWLALLDAQNDFREALPFAALNEVEAAPPSEFVPEPEPAAQDALALAFADGREAGRAEALAEAEHSATRQRALRLAFRNLDEAARDVLAADLADTVIALCETVLGDHAADSAALLARCHIAAHRIGVAAGALRLHLHPEDIARIGPDSLADWTVIADPTLEVGALLLEGPDGAVRDGPADWRRAIAAVVRG